MFFEKDINLYDVYLGIKILVNYNYFRMGSYFFFIYFSSWFVGF